MLYFATARIIFILYNFELAETLSVSDVFLLILHGAHQDASVTGYFCVLPGLLIILSPRKKPKYYRKFINIYTILLIFISTLIIISDAELYRNWRFRIDTTVLLYLKDPADAAASTDIKTYIKLLTIFVLYFSLSVFLYKKYVDKALKKFKKSDIITSLVFIFITGSLILPIRGSVGIAPMNTGMVYFSENNIFANHSAINAVWNLGSALEKFQKIEKVNFFDEKTAEKNFHFLYPPAKEKTDIDKVLKINRPNIVIVILESFTAKVVKAFGGKDGVTPNLNKIAEEGIIFKNFYATGDRTVKGIFAILSGYPSLPKTSMMSYPNKAEKVPTITEKLKNSGYSTEWVCGFDINFADIKPYLLHNKFDKVITINDFSKANINSKWGVHDHIVFNKLYEECKADTSLYFKVCMTLSSHEPFDVPMKTVFRGNDEDSRFLNSVYYTDKSIGEFIRKMKTLKNRNNTLIIFVADHGSRLPENTSPYVPGRYKIPMIWTGGAIKKDTVINKFAGQTDISATLLSLLNINTDDFIFGKDIFSKQSKSFAFYSFNNGFGFITDSTTQVFDINKNDYFMYKNTDENNVFGKAYLQYLTNDFIKK